MDRVEIKTGLLESSICYQPSNSLAGIGRTYRILYDNEAEASLTLAVSPSFISMVSVLGEPGTQLNNFSSNPDTLLYWSRVLDHETTMETPLYIQNAVYLTNRWPQGSRLALEQTHEVRNGSRLDHTSPVYVAKGRGTLIPTPRHMAGFMTLHKKRA